MAAKKKSPAVSAKATKTARTSTPKSKTTNKAAKAAKKTQAAKKKSSANRRAARAKARAASTPISRGRARRGRAVGSGSVSIRMYRGLLGDFFLLKHVQGDGQFKMLIDCGVLQLIGSNAKKPSTGLGKTRIQAGVADLMAETGGELDLVVATHEHYDHLSGFILTNAAFKTLKIKKLWLAWTEDRSDKFANSYRKKKNRALNALASLVANSALAATDEIGAVSNLLQFYGPIDPIDESGMALAKRVGDNLPGNASCETVLEWLKLRAGAGNVTYLKPGQAVRWGVGDVFRAYVLGPPREDAALRKLNPSKGDAREVYLARSEDVETIMGLAAIHGGHGSGGGPQDQPFARPHWRTYGRDARGKRKARRAVLDDAIVEMYEQAAGGYRRIDEDWLGSAETLALKIDGDVNNTSLALAFELSDKQVLLFPADAQVGNWLSWGDQTYAATDEKDGDRVTIDDLLSRTIFYKVGHHASHNATLRERGLELMTDPRLCAMIPVVEDTAHEQKNKSAPKGWSMPYPDLYTRLTQRTSGRVLRGDGKPDAEIAAFSKSIFELRYGPNFKVKDPLWVQLELQV